MNNLITAPVLAREVSRLMGSPCEVERAGDTWRVCVDGGSFEFEATDKDLALSLDEFERRFLRGPTMLSKMWEQREKAGTRRIQPGEAIQFYPSND